MALFRFHLPTIIVLLFISGSLLTAAVNSSLLHSQLMDFVADKDAEIGITVITDNADTISVNGSQSFPMLSVYKFPVALAVAEYCRQNKIQLSDSIKIAADEIKTDTYSPMREKYGKRDLSLPIAELLAYSLQQSDNNACDILFRLVGGPKTVGEFISKAGFGDMKILNTEDEMHRDIEKCYENSSTPLAMSQLLAYYRDELRNVAPEYSFIGQLLETCETGTDRLASPLSLPDDIIGHKTGTGDRNKEGHIIGINDVGYINLANGTKYIISVFVKDSTYDADVTASLIAQISEIVLNNFRCKNQ